MNLALNTMVYEAGNVDCQVMLKKAREFGFIYIDWNAWNSGDPTLMSQEKRKLVLKMFKELGLKSSQMLLINTRDIAASDGQLRLKVMNYMKKCADFQLELGGRQVIVCWGAGVYERDVIKEQTWMHSVNSIKEYAQWCIDNNLIVELELDPHVYFVLNSLEKMIKMVEDVNMPNVFTNIDIGHLCITREGPRMIEKMKDRILHAHLSETDTFEHTNSIIGSGKADFKAYIEKLNEIGIEQNCKRSGVPAVVDIEMGEPWSKVDDPDRWVRESLEHLKKILPELVF